MKKSIFALLIMVLMVALSGNAADPQDQADQTLRTWVKGLSDQQLGEELNKMAGIPDLWKSVAYNPSLRSSIRNLQHIQPLIDRSKLLSLSKADLHYFSYFAADNLKLAYAIALQAHARNLRPLAVTITSDTRAYVDLAPAAGPNRRHSLEQKLLFLKGAKLNPEEAFFESNQLIGAMVKMHNDLAKALQNATHFDSPVMIEFESAALNPDISPVMQTFFHEILPLATNNVETPNQGKILLLSPDNAFKASDRLKHNISLWSKAEENSRNGLDIGAEHIDQIRAFVCPALFDGSI